MQTLPPTTGVGNSLQPTAHHARKLGLFIYVIITEEKNVLSDLAMHLIIYNIPKRFRSTDLRNYFSEFTEKEAFNCFHFRHRPQIQLPYIINRSSIVQGGSGKDDGTITSHSNKEDTSESSQIRESSYPKPDPNDPKPVKDSRPGESDPNDPSRDSRPGESGPNDPSRDSKPGESECYDPKPASDSRPSECDLYDPRRDSKPGECDPNDTKTASNSRPGEPKLNDPSRDSRPGEPDRNEPMAVNDSRPSEPDDNEEKGAVKESGGSDSGSKLEGGSGDSCSHCVNSGLAGLTNIINEKKRRYRPNVKWPLRDKYKTLLEKVENPNSTKGKKPLRGKYKALLEKLERQNSTKGERGKLTCGEGKNEAKGGDDAAVREDKYGKNSEEAMLSRIMDKEAKGRACCVLDMKDDYVEAFYKKYYHKHWVTRDGEILPERCYLLRVKFSCLGQRGEYKYSKGWMIDVQLSNLQDVFTLMYPQYPNECK